MLKRILTLILAIGIGILFVIPAMAEVKSVKVGGDLTIKGVYRDNLDFSKDDDTVVVDDGTEGWFMTTTRVYVGAELSDNVTTMVRLLNEIDWDVETAASTDIDLDLAYVKLADLFSPGLTVTLGRQEILLGRGFVVGNSNFAGNANLRAPDLTSRKAFDAWRLDYEFGTMPLTMTALGIKVDDNSLTAGATNNEDTDLAGINFAYKLDNVIFEGYLLNAVAQAVADDFDIFTWGLRVDHNVLAMPGLNYNLEVALENGENAALDKDAWAGCGDISYSFANPYQPKIGLSYFAATGDGDAADDDDNAWSPIFPDNLATRIGDLTYAYQAANATAGVDIAAFKVYGSFKPADKHLLSLAWFPASVFSDAAAGIDDEIGWEVDAGYTYNYTDDVTFGLAADFMTAGDGIDDLLAVGVDAEDSAIQVVGTVAVVF
ncbi:MAG: alginate export family protein [Candidatus Omnitrophota bacterium]